MLDGKKIRKLYGLAAYCGILERGEKNDLFHEVVRRVTGKTSVSELTDNEYGRLLRELHALAGGQEANPRATAVHSEAPGMMTQAQRKKAWALMYDLMKHDPSSSNAGERMVGAVKALAGVGSLPRDPFRLVNFKDGNKVIEGLKGYIRTAKRKAKKAGEAV